MRKVIILMSRFVFQIIVLFMLYHHVVRADVVPLGWRFGRQCFFWRYAF